MERTERDRCVTGLLHGRTFPAEEVFDAVDSGWIAFGVPDAERRQDATTAAEVFRADLRRSPSDA